MSETEHEHFRKGVLVEVESRHWPGINKPGGTGKIQKYYRDENGVEKVDVKLILGGTDRNIGLDYVQVKEFLETNTRDRKERDFLNPADPERPSRRRASRSQPKPETTNLVSDKALKSKPKSKPRVKKSESSHPDPVPKSNTTFPAKPKKKATSKAVTNKSSLSSKPSPRLDIAPRLTFSNRSEEGGLSVKPPPPRVYKKNPVKSTLSIFEDETTAADDPTSKKRKKINEESHVFKKSKKQPFHDAVKLSTGIQGTNINIQYNDHQQEPKKEHPEKPTLPTVDEERLTIFTQALSNTLHLSKTDKESIQLDDLISEINSRMVTQAKYDEKEIRDCITNLEDTNLVMFVASTGTVYKI